MRVVVKKIGKAKKNIEFRRWIVKLERIKGEKQMDIDYYKTTFLEVIS